MGVSGGERLLCGRHTVRTTGPEEHVFLLEGALGSRFVPKITQTKQQVTHSSRVFGLLWTARSNSKGELGFKT